MLVTIPYFIYNNEYIEKKIACEQYGIKLLRIPYWWDFRKESLAATIAKV
jgi:hypothetical protein